MEQYLEVFYMYGFVACELLSWRWEHWRATYNLEFLYLITSESPKWDCTGMNQPCVHCVLSSWLPQMLRQNMNYYKFNLIPFPKPNILIGFIVSDSMVNILKFETDWAQTQMIEYDMLWSSAQAEHKIEILKMFGQSHFLWAILMFEICIWKSVGNFGQVTMYGNM